MIAALAAALAVTIGHGDVTAGPVVAGDHVVWADAPNGRPRLLRDGKVIRTWPRAHTKDTGRAVAALAASTTRTAAIVETCTTYGAFLGCADTLGRRLPARGPRRCTEQRQPESVAAGHNLIAVAEAPACQGIARMAKRSRIDLRPGGTIAATNPTHLRIAGRWLAYLDDGQAIRYDLRTHHKRSYGPANALDVQRNGKVVPGRVAAAGGRVLRIEGRRLMLDGHVLARGPITRFDLSPDRAVWVQGTRILSRDL